MPKEFQHDPARIALYEARAKQQAAEARNLTAEARHKELELKKKLRAEDDEMATDRHFHVYTFDKEVTEGSVKTCIQALTTWARQDTKCSIELRINSPGGSIMDGFALIDYLRSLQLEDHKITTVAYGMAASMAGVILQVGTERVMGANAMLLIHEGSMGAIGDYAAIKDRVKLMEMLHERILLLYAERSKMSKQAIKRKWSRTDWWLGSNEALRLGFIDAVR
jgi:ATP-dependent Clp endopeptidase proteolytic subunit ClpP